jgi:hypothetical protein
MMLDDNGSAQAATRAVPGTVHLVDLDGTMRAKHAKGARRDIVLVPEPSTDPDDPVGTNAIS